MYGYFTRNCLLKGDDLTTGECGEDFLLNLSGVTWPALLELQMHFVLERLQASQMESLEYIIQLIVIDKILS